MRALVIEDNVDIGECIGQSLTDMDITHDWFQEGHYAKSAFKAAKYDIIILDLNLPDKDGFDILKEFRLSGGTTPVLIISARISVADRVSGLDLGADDYLVKPFALDEFEARVRALLRRESTTRRPCLEFGELSFDQSSREFFLADSPFDLPPRERAVLELLLKKEGSIINKEAIANHIFNFDDEADASSIEIYIHRLRKKLAGSPVSINTRRGLGYYLALSPSDAKHK